MFICLILPSFPACRCSWCVACLRDPGARRGAVRPMGLFVCASLRLLAVPLSRRPRHPPYEFALILVAATRTAHQRRATTPLPPCTRDSVDHCELAPRCRPFALASHRTHSPLSSRSAPPVRSTPSTSAHHSIRVCAFAALPLHTMHEAQRGDDSRRSIRMRSPPLPLFPPPSQIAVRPSAPLVCAIVNTTAATRQHKDDDGGRGRQAWTRVTPRRVDVARSASPLSLLFICAWLWLLALALQLPVVHSQTNGAGTYLKFPSGDQPRNASWPPRSKHCSVVVDDTLIISQCTHNDSQTRCLVPDPAAHMQLVASACTRIELCCMSLHLDRSAGTLIHQTAR